MRTPSAHGRVVAVLGPTNTGKTHRAMERLLGHDGGMIGFPLRLLARENYERAVKVKGPRAVALITGEEKILPPNARYFLCTVESMPVERRVPFVALDEAQMGADPDRGHIFTDRLLHARGVTETMFLGAETAKPLIRKLVPEAEFDTRPRFSTLRYAGRRKITRLPARSAVVAFSAADVYAIAELIRRQRGGAAVVLGALSPRTRNAQVAMYQAGEVDYLVATDAIGMGLNMDVDHVAFAATRKFDGRRPRALAPAELAQIAGRAGRHLNDGTFGVTAEVPPLDEETVRRIENHEFEPLDFLYWRNDRLRFTSIADLKTSLERPPGTPGLIRARQADDERALEFLARDPAVAAAATTPDQVRLLWEVCRIPDFGHVMTDAHTRLLARVFGHLAGPGGRLPADWVAANIERLDRADGDIDVLTQRLAHIRTWTYVAFHADWLDDADHWRGRARMVEDSLSDALHQALTKRFVDRRTAVLMRALKDRGAVRAEVSGPGRVSVEGQEVGHLEGFRFVADRAEGERRPLERAVANVALRALRGETARRVDAFLQAPDGAFALAAEDGRAGVRILWEGAVVGRLEGGADVLSPLAAPLDTDLLEAPQRERLRAHLAAWLDRLLERGLGPLRRLATAPLEGAARGLAFQVAEGLGSLPRAAARDQIDALATADRRALRALGLRLGRESVFLPALLKPAAIRLRAALWGARHGRPLIVPAPGRISIPLDPAVPAADLEAIGFRPLGALAVRVDMVERIAVRAFALARAAPFAAGPELSALAGCGAEEIGGVLAALGYRPETTDAGPTRFRPPRRPTPPRPPRPSEARRLAESPFAVLKEIARP